MISDTAAALLQLDRIDCEESLLCFTKKMFLARTGNEFIVSHHHLAIIEALEQTVNGELPNGCRNLLINMPPRYGKTELAVISFVAWCMARNPAAKFIHLSYADRLALDNSSQIRDLMKQEEYVNLWPVSWRQDTDAKGLWKTTEGGGLMASAAGGTITGFGAGSTELMAFGMNFAGAIIIDDALKPDDAFSDIIRASVNERLSGTIQSRRNSRETPIILIMQRLHQDDMTGYILSGAFGEGFHHVLLPALSDDGEALWPHKHTAFELENIRKSDPYMFAGQYQQLPAPKGGGIIKWEDWRPWLKPAYPYCSYVIASLDTAYTEKEENDPSALTIWGVFHADDGAPKIIMMHAWQGRVQINDLVTTAVEQCRRFKVSRLLIEAKASGLSVSQEIRRLFQFEDWSIQMVESEAPRQSRSGAFCGSLVL